MPVRPSSACISLAQQRYSCLVKRNCCLSQKLNAASRFTRAPFLRALLMERVSSPAAMMARSAKPVRTASIGCWPPTTRSAGSITSPLGPDGAIAWSAGKTAHVRTKKGELRIFEAPSTVAGLAFARKDSVLPSRTTMARRSGFRTRPVQSPSGSNGRAHISASPISPDGKFLITTMQESTLHGWRMADAKHMRMSGYSARVRSLSWSAGGDFLATSGSEQLILWPFDGKDGPMGRQPKILARAESRVAVVACHPRQPVVAVGYADGAVRLVRIEDDALILRARGGRTSR